jgi:superfamily II RNA helicase
VADVRFVAGFGKTLSKLLRRRDGVHHAGMLPRYRRLVEHCAGGC